MLHHKSSFNYAHTFGFADTKSDCSHSVSKQPVMHRAGIVPTHAVLEGTEIHDRRPYAESPAEVPLKTQQPVDFLQL